MTLPDGEHGLSPEALEHADFRMVMRGFDRVEVQRLLSAGAAEIRRLRSRLDVLASEVAKPVSLEDLTEEQLVARLGDEAISVLHAAQESANQILANSMEKAAEIESDALSEVGNLRRSAEADRATVIMNAKTEVSGAESTAAKLKYHAVHEADKAIGAAREEAQKIVAEVTSDKQTASREIEAMHEAAKTELKMLIAARDEMLEAFASAGTTLRTAVEQLDGSGGDIEAIQSSIDQLLGEAPEVNSEQIAQAEEVVADVAEDSLEETPESEGFDSIDPEDLRGDVTEFLVEPQDELEKVRVIEDIEPHEQSDSVLDEMASLPLGESGSSGVRVLNEAPEGYMPSPNLLDVELPETVEPETLEEEVAGEAEEEVVEEVIVESEVLEEDVQEVAAEEVLEEEPAEEVLEEEQLILAEAPDTEEPDSAEPDTEEHSAEIVDLVPRERVDEPDRDLGPVAEVVDIRERGERDLYEAIDPAELLGPVTAHEGGPLAPLPGEYIEGPDTDPVSVASENLSSEAPPEENSDSIGGLFDRIRGSDSPDSEQALAPAVSEAPVVEDPLVDEPELLDEAIAEDERQLHDPIQARDEYLLMRRDNAAAECSELLARRLKRVFMDEQNELLDQLRRWSFDGATSDSEEILPHMGAVIQRSALPSLQRARVAGGTILDVAIDSDADVTEEAAALSSELVDSLKGRIQRSLIDGLEGAEGRVRAIFREWRSERLGPAVETAVFTALGHGILAAVEPDAMVRWVCPIDHECVEGADNELVGIIVKGAEFPSGHAMAPAYSGCRCLVVPADR